VESAAAAAFYIGLVAFVYGIVRTTTASIERRGRDVFGIATIALGIVLFTTAIIIFIHSPKSILPF
jgi:uncharacterized membrane protein HdeD (DUF308 family)